MNGNDQRLSWVGWVRRALPTLLAIVIILAGVTRNMSAHADHVLDERLPLVIMTDATFPSDAKGQDHLACNLGTGCNAFTLPAAEDFPIHSELSASIEFSEVAQLVTRDVAPPQPPPKFTIPV